MAKLAEFNFDTKYQPGRSNANADSLSLLPREEVATVLNAGCNVSSIATQGECQRNAMQRAESLHKPGIELIPGLPKKELRRLQEKDAVISHVRSYLPRQRAPSAQERQKEETPVLTLLNQWKQLQLVEGILYRRTTILGEGQIQQVVLPEKLQREVFEALHMDTGYMGIDHMVDIIHSRCYWPGHHARVMSLLQKVLPKKERHLLLGQEFLKLNWVHDMC
ncbi:unnamed protein product [Lepidochelys olivacea]